MCSLLVEHLKISCDIQYIHVAWWPDDEGSGTHQNKVNSINWKLNHESNKETGDMLYLTKNNINSLKRSVAIILYIYNLWKNDYFNSICFLIYTICSPINLLYYLVFYFSLLMCDIYQIVLCICFALETLYLCGSQCKFFKTSSPFNSNSTKTVVLKCWCNSAGLHLKTLYLVLLNT